MSDSSAGSVDEGMNATLARLGDYFMGKSPLQLAAEALADRLDALNVDYAVSGALAVNYHGVMRATEDLGSPVRAAISGPVIPSTRRRISVSRYTSGNDRITARVSNAST